MTPVGRGLSEGRWRDKGFRSVVGCPKGHQVPKGRNEMRQKDASWTLGSPVGQPPPCCDYPDQGTCLMSPIVSSTVPQNPLLSLDGEFPMLWPGGVLNSPSPLGPTTLGTKLVFLTVGDVSLHGRSCWILWSRL